MSVYFMQPTDGGYVKIGSSIDVDRRRVELERQYGCSLAILKTLPGDDEEEQTIHKQFDHLRVKTSRRGPRPEQFQPAPELMDFIGHPHLSDHIVKFDVEITIRSQGLGKQHEEMARLIAENNGWSFDECIEKIYFDSDDITYGAMRQQIEKTYKETIQEHHPQDVSLVDVGEEWAWI